MTRCRSCNQTLARPAVSEPVPSKLESDTVTGTLDRGTAASTSGEKLRVECACGAGIRVGIALRGKRVKCPKCSAAVLVPVLQDSSSSQIAPAIERPSSVPRPKESLSGDSSVVRQSAESSVTSRSADDQTLLQAIESAAKLPIPTDAVSAPQGRLSSRKLRKICNQLETANVLSDSDTIARRQSLLELGQSQDSQVLEILVEHSQDTLSVIRDGAVTALGELGDPAGVPTVLRALLDRDADVIRAAFTTLKKIGDRRVVRALLRYGIERPQWKPLANDTLVRLGPRVTQELLSLLQTNDAGLMLDAIVLLGRIGDKQAVPSLIASLSHVSNLLKAHVTEALALIGDPSSVPQLLQMLQDPCATVRANAASGLVRLVDHRAFRPLLNALQDEDSDVRRYAAIALGELGEAKAVPELLKVLQGWELLVTMDTPFVEAIVETVGKLGDASSVTGLLPLLGSNSEGVMIKTVLALKKLRLPAAIPALIALLQAPQPALRRRVVETLGQIGDVALVPVLGELLRQDASREVRATAARSLGELKAREACPFLEEALREEFSIRCQAVIALGAIQERSTLPALMAMLKDGAPEVRYHAVNAIAKFKDSKTLKALAVMLEDSDPMVRSGASKVIEELSNLVNEHNGVKQIVRRAKSRNYIDSLVPKWVFLFMPTRKVALSGLAGLLLICLLGPVGHTLWIGPPTRVVSRGKVAELTMSPDGSTLVAERTLGMLEVWDVNRESVLKRLSNESGKSPRFRAKDGLVLVLGDSLIPWKLSDRPDTSTGWKVHRQPIVALHTTPGGEFAATMDREGTTVVWDLVAGRKAGQLKLDPRFKQSLTVSPKGRLLAASNTTGDVGVWNVESGERLREIPHVQGTKSFVKFSFNSTETWLVGAENLGGLSLFDLEGKSPSSKVKAVELAHPIVPVEVRFLPDDQRVLAADEGGDVFVWNLETEESAVVCRTGFSPLNGFAMNSDGTQFAAGSSERTEVVIFSLETGKPIKRLDAK
ncbi:MAG: HEAT repeat domain-containing protein [Planctomycetaceae bacterium]